MMMAQLIRRTKKCCAKILRKLSFSDASSQPAQIVQRCSNRNRYVQQINRTPNRCKIAPSPDHSSIQAFQSSPSHSMIFVDFHHTNTHHSRTKFNKSFHSGRRNRQANCSNVQTNGDQCISPPSATTSNTFGDEEIIFTENRIYASMAERSSRSKQQRWYEADHSPCENNATNEIIFEKVKLNRQNEQIGSEHRQHENGHQNIMRALFPFETSTDVSANGSMYSATMPYDYENSSPCKRLAEYENLNESFWHSPDNDGGVTCSHGSGRGCETSPASSNSKSTYAETWDYIGINRITSVPIPPTANANMVQNKYEIHYESAVSASSRRTSISTTETWIDDEVFDNSFNEKLEKRCVKLCTKCH